LSKQFVSQAASNPSLSFCLLIPNADWQAIAFAEAIRSLPHLVGSHSSDCLSVKVIVPLILWTPGQPPGTNGSRSETKAPLHQTEQPNALPAYVALGRLIMGLA